MLVTLDEARLQINETTDEHDIELIYYIDSALDVVQRHIDKEMVSSFDGIDQELIDSGRVILFSPGLRAATLMLITHLFENKGIVSDEQMRVLPMGYRYILDQHRTPSIG